MALVLKDRVRQTSTTAGTGTITLSGSVTGYQDFTVIGTGNTTYYTIADQSGSNWEVGLGTYTAPNQLARTTVYESSNGNALVDFGSNIKDVFVTLPAEAASGGGVVSVTASSPVQSTGGTNPEISILAATTATSGYLTSTDWNIFNGKQTALVSGTNIKTVNSTSLLGSGDVSVGVTSVTASTTPVNGLSLSGGTITGSGTIGITGTLNLSSPPAIGGTTAAAITGTTVTAKSIIYLPTKTPGNFGEGYIELVDGGGGYEAFQIYAWDNDNLAYYQVQFPGGIQGTPISLLSPDFATNYQYINLTTPSGMSAYYTLTLPATAGSANQVLKTDGTGVTSWVNLNAPSIYTTTSPQNSTSTTLANITGLTATLDANTTYRVDCFVTFQSAATTTGINFGFTSPTGTTCMLEVVVPITNTAAASQLRTIFPNNSSTNSGNVLGTGVSTINNNHTARFSGIIKVGGTGGTFAARYATEVAASAITIPAGSTMVIQKIS